MLTIIALIRLLVQKIKLGKTKGKTAVFMSFFGFRKLKTKWKIYTAIVIDITILFMLVVLISSYMGNLTALTALTNLLSDKAQTEEEFDDEYGWSWSVNPETGDIELSGGIYPKDPQLKQLAMFIEAMEVSAATANSSLGTSSVSAGSILGLNIRESGGRVVARLTGDTSLNIFRDLIHETPACGKGSKCGYSSNGLKHFTGDDDPKNNHVNTDKNDYNKAGGDHAIGYFQLESPYVDGYLRAVYPVGDFKDKQYNASTDKYKMDSTLSFIRPNAVFLPDSMIAAGVYLGDSSTLGSGYKQAWSEIQAKPWFNGLSDKEKHFLYGSLKDMSYQSGPNISYSSIKPLIATFELLAALKTDGYMANVYDIVDYIGKITKDDILSRLYSQSSLSISKPSDTVWFNGFNKILNDSSLKSSSSTAASNLKSQLKQGKFKTYAEAGNRVLYEDIPAKSIGWQSAGMGVFEIMKQQVAGAEMEEPPQGGGTGNGLAPPSGVSKDNFKQTPGKGQGTYNGSTAEQLVGTTALGKALSKWWGTSVVLNTCTDKYNSTSYKFAVPSYSQGDNGTEKWKGYRTPGGWDLQAEGCHIYMYAHIASAVQQRLINPAETLAVGTKFGIFDKNGLFNNSITNANKYFGSFGCTSTWYAKSNLKNYKTDGITNPWTRLDKALRSNVPSGLRIQNTWGFSNHFLVIRDVTADGRYLLSQTTAGTRVEHQTYSREQIYNMMYSGGGKCCLYIVTRK